MTLYLLGIAYVCSRSFRAQGEIKVEVRLFCIPIGDL